MSTKAFLIHQIGVVVSAAFLDYIENKPLVFEVFGHYYQQPSRLERRVTSPRYYPVIITVSRKKF